MALPAFLNVSADRGDSVVALFLVSYFLPRVFQPFLGYLTDRINAKKVALTSELVRAGLFVALAFYPREFNTEVWLLLGFLCSIFSCLFDPAKFKLMSAVAKNFLLYNSIFNVFFSFVGILATVASIFLEYQIGTEVIFLFNAATFLVSAGMLRNIQYDHAMDENDGFSLFKEVLVGVHYILEKPILYLFVSIVTIDFFTGMIYEMLPLKSKEIDLGHYGVYILSGFAYLGNTLGSFFIANFENKYRHLALLLLIQALVVPVLFGASQQYLLYFTMLIFFAIQILFIGLLEVVIEKRVPSLAQGRAFAMSESIPIVALTIGSAFSNEIGLHGKNYMAIVLFTVVAVYVLYEGRQKVAATVASLRNNS